MAEAQGRKMDGYEWGSYNECLGVVRSILFRIMDYQFPKLQAVEITDERRLADALERINEAMQLPAGAPRQLKPAPLELEAGEPDLYTLANDKD